MPTWCAGSATSTDGWIAPGPPTPNSPSWPPASPGCSGTGPGSPAPGDEDDKSPVTGDCHAGICGSRGCNAPGYPTLTDCRNGLIPSSSVCLEHRSRDTSAVADFVPLGSCPSAHGLGVHVCGGT